MEITNVTLCFLRRNNEILLAMKKRGFGKGKWNGAGGKLLEGESFKDAAVREAKEEIGVEIQATSLQHVALLDFYFEGGSKNEQPYGHHCKVYFVNQWKGEAHETEEMRPRWFQISDLPLTSMWSDDSLWLPQVIQGHKLHAKFWFNKEFQHTKYQISPLEENAI